MKSIKERKRLKVKTATEKELFSWWSVLNDDPKKYKSKIAQIWREMDDRGYRLRYDDVWMRIDGVWRRDKTIK
jgi:hypothetical protein